MTKGDVPARAKGIQVDEAAINATVDMALAEYRELKPSMLQDVLAGRLTEIDALNGGLTADAEGVGVRTPTIATLWHLVKLLKMVRI